MIPILYESNETEFKSNGLGRLRDCVRCEVTEERNGIYELELEYPLNGSNYEKIIPGRIIAVEHDLKGDIQPFIITSYSRPLDGVVTFRAVHISYCLSYATVFGMANIYTLQSAFDYIKEYSFPDMDFDFWTDKTSTGYLSVANGLPLAVKPLLGGIEGSILDIYGGEYEFDKKTVRLWDDRGMDRNYTIRYGVNLTDFNEEVDFTDTYNKVVPYWTKESDNVYGFAVGANLKTFDGRDRVIPMDFTDRFETTPTVSDLETAAVAWVSSNTPNMPKQNISINFVRLADADEYKMFSPMQAFSLCDRVNVIFPKYGIGGKYKIVKIVWDVLLERYNEMELGNLSTSLAQALGLN